MADYLYRQVYDDLKRQIQAGLLPVGERLPNEKELTQQYRVSPITLKRALDILREEGYVLRRPGVGTVVIGSLPQGRQQPRAGASALGLVVTSFDDTFGTRVLEGILDEAGERHVVIKRTAGVSSREEAHLAGLLGLGVEGIILHPTSSDYIPPTVLKLVAEKMPIVILDRAFDGVPVSSVTSANYDAAREATRYLFDRGHRRVAFIGSISQVSTMRDRRRGFVNAHAAHHVKLRDDDVFLRVSSTVPSASVSVDEDIAALRDFIRERPDVTACVVGEYNEALMLREACRLEGKTVPEDMSIVCFDHPDAWADRHLFRFTHVRQDQEELGRVAIRLLLQQIDEPGYVERRQLPTALVEGQSVQTL